MPATITKPAGLPVGGESARALGRRNQTGPPGAMHGAGSGEAMPPRKMREATHGRVAGTSLGEPLPVRPASLR